MPEAEKKTMAVVIVKLIKDPDDEAIRQGRMDEAAEIASRASEEYLEKSCGPKDSPRQGEKGRWKDIPLVWKVWKLDSYSH